jgi:hypothetical protein
VPSLIGHLAEREDRDDRPEFPHDFRQSS